MSLTESGRPQIYDYSSPSKFIGEMLLWRRTNHPDFSVRKELKKIGGLSPALVSQLRTGKRSLTRDRVEPLSELLQLNLSERAYLDQWTHARRMPNSTDVGGLKALRHRDERQFRRPRQPRMNLFSDWVNIYVRDAVDLRGIHFEPKSVFQRLGGIASPRRIEKAMRFLLHEGFLKRTLAGKIVKNQSIEISTDDIPSRKLTDFHAQALKIAKEALRKYDVSERHATTVTLSVNRENLAELRGILKDFRLRLEKFMEAYPDDDERLYQIVVHLSPIGGNFEK